MNIITRYDRNKGKATVLLQKPLPLSGKAETLFEQAFAISDGQAIAACQNQLYRQIHSAAEARRRSLNHPPAAISRSGNKRRD